MKKYNLPIRMTESLSVQLYIHHLQPSAREMINCNSPIKHDIRTMAYDGVILYGTP